MPAQPTCSLCEPRLRIDRDRFIGQIALDVGRQFSDFGEAVFAA